MSIFKQLENGLKDLSQLKVQTYTGNLSTVIKDQAGSPIDWENLMTTGIKDGTIKLVAYTNVKLDGNSVAFYEENIPQDLAQKHDLAVTAAQTYRTSLLKLFEKEIGSLIHHTATTNNQGGA